MKKNIIVLIFVSIATFELMGAENLLLHEKLNAQVAALVAKTLKDGINEIVHPFAQDDGSYHLMHSSHLDKLQIHPLQIGDIIVTSVTPMNRVIYSVYGDSVRTRTNPTDSNQNWSVIVKAGEITFMSTYYHGQSFPQSEKKYRSVS